MLPACLRPNCERGPVPPPASVACGGAAPYHGPVTPPTDLVLLPLSGPWHLHHPRWNVVTVQEALAALSPTAVLSSALPPGYDREPDWQAVDELALPWTVAPWARAAGTPLAGLAQVVEAGAEDEFRRYLGAYPSARQVMAELDRGLAPLRELLPQALDLPRLLAEVVPLLEADWRARAATFGEGPGTGWRQARAQGVVQAWQEAVAGGGAPGTHALLVELELWPALTQALDEAGAGWAVVEAPPPSPASRRRSLLDLAWRDEVPDVMGLLEQLRQTPSAEALFLEAQLLLAHGEAAGALAVMERAALQDFSRPYLLPGMLLARLGQLRDLAGQRSKAMQAYRGALALSWAPAEAREAASAGLAAPFRLPDPAATGEP